MIAVLFIADLGPGAAHQGRPPAQRDQRDVPGEDRAHAAAGRPLLPGPARGRRPAGRPRRCRPWPPSPERGDHGVTGEKTEKATPKKRKQNRKEGQVPRTQELGAWSASLLVAMALPKLLGHELDALQRAHDRRRSASAATPRSTGAGHPGPGSAGTCCVTAAWSWAAGIAVVGVAGALAQGGFFLATSSVKPKLSKLNPLQGIKRIFGCAGALGGRQDADPQRPGRCASSGSRSRPLIPLIGGLVPMQVRRSTGRSPVRSRLVRNVAIVGLVLAGADYIVQRRTDRQADPDDQGGRQAGAQAGRGRPDAQGRDPVPAAGRRPATG